MRCQICNDKDLIPVYTEQGVEIDYCPDCRGIWLDKGEIYYFTRKPAEMEKEINDAIRKGGPESSKSCPRTGKPMIEISVLGGKLKLGYCPSSGGIWFDEGELEKITKTFGDTFRLKFDKNTIPGLGDIASRPTALPGLPNLFIRSAGVLVLLYGLLGIVLITLVELTGLTPGAALLIAVIIAGIQFLLGPFLMDLSLRFMYRMSWVDYEELPRYLSEFIRNTCEHNQMKAPRMGIIHDGAPNAFTYGHTPNNARIVLTEGLLDLLNEDEVKGVTAHEIGHAKHWDMLVMTAAQLVPLILYYVFRTLISMRSTGREDKTAGPRIAIAVASFILYIIAQYLVLWLSRTREYWADRFGGRETGDPSSLASALVKIGYGLAGRESARQQEKKEERSAGLQAVGALGIFDTKAGVAMAVSSLRAVSAARKMGGEIDKDNLKGAMKWDLWNPWAKYYELNSTHPLIANRIRHLSAQSEVMGKEPFVRFDERKPESYWDEFFVDLSIRFLPVLAFLGFVAASVSMNSPAMIGAGLLAAGFASFIKTGFSYRSDAFPEMSVASLLKKVKVSAVRPVCCTLKGRIIGRGVPGLIWSEDFVMQDDTGIIFLDYRQPISLWDFFFGLLKRARYQNQEAEVVGWYRRMPVPFIEIRSIRVRGENERKCYTYLAKYAMAGILALAGLYVMFVI